MLVTLQKVTPTRSYRATQCQLLMLVVILAELRHHARGLGTWKLHAEDPLSRYVPRVHNTQLLPALSSLVNFSSGIDGVQHSESIRHACLVISPLSCHLHNLYIYIHIYILADSRYRYISLRIHGGYSHRT